MPKAFRRFNEEGIESQDMSNVSDYEWHANIKHLKWFGPFEFTKDCLTFHTATAQGIFQGFILKMNFTWEKDIFLEYMGKNGTFCGETKGFNNAKSIE